MLLASGSEVCQHDLASHDLGANAVLPRYWAGKDVTQNSRERYVVDLTGMSEAEAKQKFPHLFQHLFDYVRPERLQNNDKGFRENWWLFGRRRPEMREALAGVSKYLVTSEVSKHRFFVFLEWPKDLIDGSVIAIAVESTLFLSILSSRAHVVWAVTTGGRMGVGNDPRYQNVVVFDPFPFPDPDEPTKERLRELGERLDAFRKERQAEHSDLTMTGM